MINKMPKHIAIIMDGNGRWAKANNKTRLEGHKRGVQSVRNIIQKSLDIGLKNLTLYTFSKDNWKRPKLEVNGLMNLFSETIKNEFDNFQKNGVNVSFIGNISTFPSSIQSLVKKTSKDTFKNKTLNLNIAFGYSSREEIVDASKKIADKVINNNLKINDINEAVFSQNLYQSNLSDPDLLIRTSGEHRISDFMLWQIAYSEIFFVEKYWPDFNGDDFLELINEYKNRERRYGKISEQVLKL